MDEVGCMTSHWMSSQHRETLEGKETGLSPAVGHYSLDACGTVGHYREKETDRETRARHTAYNYKYSGKW